MSARARRAAAVVDDRPVRPAGGQPAVRRAVVGRDRGWGRVKLTVQVVLETDDDQDPAVVCDVFTLERGARTADTVGLRLAEANDLLAAVQQTLVAPNRPGPQWPPKRAARIAGRRTGARTAATSSCAPCSARCGCPAHAGGTARADPNRPARSARWPPPYRTAAPRNWSTCTVRRHTYRVGQRLDDDLGPERPFFVEGYPADWAELPRPDLPLTVSLDGGYVHSARQRSRRDGWFEVIAGKSVPADGPAKCFGFVQTHDTKPKRRLFELLAAQGMQANQQVTFRPDGADDVRALPLYLNPQAEHLLDWFHVTMRLTVLTQLAKGLRAPPPAASADNSVAAQLARLKWLTEVVSAEETSTQVELGFTAALQVEGLLARVEARHDDGRVDLTVEDETRPILLLSLIHL